MMKFENRIIALRDEEIQQLNETIINLRAAGHKILDELAASHAQIRALREQIADYELLLENEDTLSTALADALETINRLQQVEVKS